MKFLFSNTTEVHSTPIKADMPDVRVEWEPAYREDAGVDRKAVEVPYIDKGRQIGVILTVPRIVEKEASNSDELGLRYAGFRPTTDEGEAASEVNHHTVVGLFESLSGKGICGFGMYRPAKK